MKELLKTFITFGEKTRGKKTIQNHGHRQEDNIKMYLEVDWEAVVCINLFNR
jgi:hypothetical protein